MKRHRRVYSRVGERIASLAGTQREVGRVLGITQQCVSKKLRGETAILLSDLEKLARHYEVPMTFFFEGPADPPKPARCREGLPGMPREIQELVCLAGALTRDELGRLLTMAELLAGDRRRTCPPAQSLAST
jgi:transcriptional regulator with XRE-family HTH domain